MSSFASLIAAMTVDALEGFDRDAAIAAGMNPSKVNEWEQVHNAYFGPTRYLKLQRKALERARANSFTLDQLVFIEKKLAGVEDRAARAELRATLVGARRSFAGLRELAKQVVPKPQEKAPQKQVRVTRYRMGMGTIIATLPERVIADWEHQLRAGLDPDRPDAPQMADKLEAMLTSQDGAANSIGVPAAVPTPIVIVPVEAQFKILGEAGDDVILGLTDGTTMTGAEYLNKYYGAELQVALFHPEVGAVNVYGGRRYANAKQRKLAKLVSPVCAWPDCKTPAERCEAHHVTAWKRGGQTNMSNLAMLCPYHNRVNDDDPDDPGGQQKRRRRAGRMVMARGRPVRRSPSGYLAENQYHPYGAMRQLFGELHQC